MVRCSRKSIFICMASLGLAAITTAPAAVAQESDYTTVTNRLHPHVHVRFQLRSEKHGEQWFEGGVGHSMIRVGPGNLETCTGVTVPALSEEDWVYMAPLQQLERLQARSRDEEEWTSMNLAALLEAEPEQCENDASPAYRGPLAVPIQRF